MMVFELAKKTPINTSIYILYTDIYQYYFIFMVLFSTQRKLSL